MDRVIFKDCAIQIMFDTWGVSGEAVGRPGGAEKPVNLTVYHGRAGGTVDPHRAAFSHFIENTKKYEDRLLAYFLAAVNKVADAAVENTQDPGLEGQMAEYSLRSLDGVKKLISWSGLVLYDHGWDGVGFVTMDFECSWDEEHGISLLMHKDKIIAESGLADFTNRGDFLIAHAKCIQGFSDGYDIQLP